MNKEMLYFVDADYDNYSVLISYTATGVMVAISENPLVSVLVEYNNKGEVVMINTDCDKNVKEIKDEK
jgi:hypothetical protein